MQRSLPLLFITFIVLVSCGGDRNRLRIRGQFDNLPQADLLLYSPDGGLMSIDTLHIVKGKFDYKTKPVDREVYTYTIIYPNFMTLSFQAHAGTEIKIKGDALNLSQVAVEGADTVFSSEKRKAKRSIVVGKPLPKSKLITPVKGKYLLLGFWAEWKYGSNQVITEVRRALEDEPDSLQAFTYSLDMSPVSVRTIMPKEDSLKWERHCDYMGWGGSLLMKYGIRNIPYYILVGPDGKVAAVGTDFRRDIKEHLPQRK